MVAPPFQLAGQFPKKQTPASFVVTALKQLSQRPKWRYLWPMRRPSWFAIEATVLAVLLAASLLIGIFNAVRTAIGG